MGATARMSRRATTSSLRRSDTGEATLTILNVGGHTSGCHDGCASVSVLIRGVQRARSLRERGNADYRVTRELSARRGDMTGRSPVDRGKPGSESQVLSDPSAVLPAIGTSDGDHPRRRCCGRSCKQSR